jgi:hypothetical protein
MAEGVCARCTFLFHRWAANEGLREAKQQAAYAVYAGSVGFCIWRCYAPAHARADSSIWKP